MKTAQYIDTNKETYTKDELVALLTGQAKPYPKSYYQTEKSLVTRKNASKWVDYQTLDHDDSPDYSEFSCPVNKWEYLTLDR
ncbi:hypothetical protein BLD44_028605 [Mastigocladus laminosus UU774]|nr:hypothetical protein BLD44_028605 [Mastigocladus laminosus UU774]